MPKLATPIQYEPALEGLNDIRPLQLADESKIVIAHPVFCKNPPSAGKPAVGMFARCSQQGALLKSNNTWSDKIESHYLRIDDAYPIYFYTFAQKVYGIIAFWERTAGVAKGYWCDPSGTQKYIELSTITYTFLPFVGTIIWFLGESILGWDAKVWFTGFYK